MCLSRRINASFTFFVVGWLLSQPLGAEPINDYAPEIRVLETEKEPKRVHLKILVLKGKISLENFERKQTNGVKNPNQYKVLEALKKHINSPDQDVRQAALELQQEITEDEPPGMADECNRLNKLVETIDKLEKPAEAVSFYASYCVKSSSGTGLAFFKSIKEINTVAYHDKLSLAERLNSEDQIVVDFLVKALRLSIDENDRNLSYRVLQSLCKGRGLSTARRIKPLLTEAAYYDSAARCLSMMKPEIWPEIVPLLESGKYFQVKQAIDILNYLRPKGILPAINERINQSRDEGEIELLRLLRVKISKAADEQLEEILLKRSKKDSSASRTEFLPNVRLIDYYAEIGKIAQVDAYLVPLLEKRRKGLYWEICEKYQRIGRASAAAKQLLEKIQAEESAESWPPTCKNIITK